MCKDVESLQLLAKYIAHHTKAGKILLLALLAKQGRKI